MQRGKLFLIPTVIAENTQEVIPSQVTKSLIGINDFLAENIRTARRYLSSLKIYDSIEPLNFNELNKTTKKEDLMELCKPLLMGKNMGVLSESGCPGIADPGALAVEWAHKNSIQVIPLVGPSSIVLALMASGLNGQCFGFNGYLPVNQKEAAKAIREFEKESLRRNQTQIFIETPYRNNSLLKNLLSTLNPSTSLCIAQNLTGNSESVKTLPVKSWKLESIDMPKEPVIFLFLA